MLSRWLAFEECVVAVSVAAECVALSLNTCAFGACSQTSRVALPESVCCFKEKPPIVWSVLALRFCMLFEDAFVSGFWVSSGGACLTDC